MIHIILVISYLIIRKYFQDLYIIVTILAVVTLLLSIILIQVSGIASAEELGSYVMTFSILLFVEASVRMFFQNE